MNQGQQDHFLEIGQRIRTISVYSFVLLLPISIAFSQISLSVLVFTYLCEAAFTRRFSFPRTPVNLPLLGYIIATLLATLFSLHPGKSFKELETLLIITVFYAIYQYIQDISHVKTLVKLFILSVSLAAFYGVLQHFLELDIFRLSRPISLLKHVNDDLTAPVRVPGFSSYMTFSEQLAMAIPIICALFLAAKNVTHKVLFTTCLLLTSFALLWTYTRSSWLGAICAIILLGYLRHKRFLLVFLTALLLLLIVALIFQPQLSERISSIFWLKDNIERIYTWESTAYMIRDYPILGIGKGNYSKIVDSYRMMYGDFEFTSRAHAHNNILQVTVEGGILALSCFLWLWGMIFRELYRTYCHISPKHPDLKFLSLGCFCATIAFFVQGFFEHSFGDSETMMMLWCILAIAFKLRFLTATEKISEHESYSNSSSLR